MYTVVPRAARGTRAVLVAALAAIGACVDEPVAPRTPSTPKADVQGTTPIEVFVTNTSGGTDVGSLRWAVDQIKFGGGQIVFDSTLGGKTITLEVGLDLPRDTDIWAPANGVTISGKDQFRLITSRAFLVLRNVTLTKGYGDYGSAIQGVSVMMLNTTVQDNRGGPAIFVEKSLHMANSTVSRNTVAQPAVFYLNGASVLIEQSTIAYNGPAQGIGMFDAPSPTATVALLNAIISNNGQQNCYNTYGFTYWGTNISSDWSCGEVGITVADPKLLPLANNGGPNMTHAIPHTSPAFNTGIDCYWERDQRYVKRDAKCDVGAFEFNDFTNVTITVDPSVKVDATGKALLTGTIKCTRDDTFRLALELHQDQKTGKEVVDVHAASDVPVMCSTSAKPWSATMGLAAGEAFQAGAASATVATFQTPDWMTPANVARAVKISFARK